MTIDDDYKDLIVDKFNVLIAYMKLVDKDLQQELVDLRDKFTSRIYLNSTFDPDKDVE